ncbi:hypothetical protein BO70DRAFT_15139 [Aspergillus heteromorphus CBS 117.55]|uniref:Mediator of RNA polymerase II transcription subunit 9 n=1 Tax=Aspergillus heteromorphus CBS 117.55 TaxID=1448321 RepID=A0A317X2Q3_9EURO|nr:uncharacterized protein BO70DRAFT_15139 [Aspergillus heteromorphus CBS 117.55]PWY92625.1 hypothetical protein BO70DRAFT_15139 [Aspergillus heteromorphus CBS 117.55]
MASRSPTAAMGTPLPKPSAVPETPMIKDAPTTPQAVPFPSPQTFDIIPPLHGLLLRLLSPSNNGNDVRPGEDPNGATAPAAPGQSQSQQQQQQQQSENHSTHGGVLLTIPSAGPGPVSAAAEIAALGSNIPAPLDIKNLPTEVSSIKIRIQKAHAVVENLPDVDRSVAEQEEEIGNLEDRIARLKSVIADFGQRAGKPKARGP